MIFYGLWTIAYWDNLNTCSIHWSEVGLYIDWYLLSAVWVYWPTVRMCRSEWRIQEIWGGEQVLELQTNKSCFFGLTLKLWLIIFLRKRERWKYKMKMSFEFNAKFEILNANPLCDVLGHGNGPTVFASF